MRESPTCSAKSVAGELAHEAAVLDREAQHLGEARLAGAEEARHPDRDAFVRLVRRLAVLLEDAGVVPLMASVATYSSISSRTMSSSV